MLASTANSQTARVEITCCYWKYWTDYLAQQGTFRSILDLCAWSCARLFRALLGDQAGPYSPTEFNARLLLGLKGTMVEQCLLTRHPTCRQN
jgi:hypothetical protein